MCIRDRTQSTGTWKEVMWYLERRPSYSVLPGTPKLRVSSSDDDEAGTTSFEDTENILRTSSPSLEEAKEEEVGDYLHAQLDPENTTEPVCIFGTVAPRGHMELSKVEHYAKRLANTLITLRKETNGGLDGIIIYDIQEEENRENIERPFKYCSTHPPRLFAKHLQEFTGIDVIVYRCVSSRAKEGFDKWLCDTWQKYHTKVCFDFESNLVNSTESIMTHHRILSSSEVLQVKTSSQATP
eukprot:TRINITY_DN2147_c0_g1_i2.p1 TRINITY_DN2147_c0_g1~~TRINITY_DN2147_c0_g1_i2.p1  ORF type:complete len:240 (+),score=34.02 TRINITY_DN2147_c0_g1_i2:47-766(+)